MISYGYNTQMTPPAPFVHVKLRNPDGSAQVDQVPAQVDSAADRTAIPDTVATALGLIPIRNLPVGGVGGYRSTVPTSFVELAVHDLPFRDFEVFVIAGEPWVHLGRDVLNNYPTVLDGPRLGLDIDTPPAPAGGVQPP
jgi:hypothetical protein